MIHLLTKPDRLLAWLRKVIGNEQLVLALLAVAIGLLAGWAIVLFREGIGLFQLVAFGTDSEFFLPFARDLPWWQLIAAPTAGGLLIGLFIWRFMPGQRPQGVADVIEAGALGGGRMSLLVGLKAALLSAASIGVGASVGREGPAVHLGASIAGWSAEKLKLNRVRARTLLGCGVAAAVAGSFNAPIAGALFAGEVVLGHYALSAFAPVVMASVVSTMISRSYFGDFPAFLVPTHTIQSPFEFAGFIALGLAGGLIAVAFLRLTEKAADTAAELPIPPWARPALGGLLLGLLATQFPEVLGIGYGITDSALSTSQPVELLLILLVAKLVATALCIGFGFSGGVFSPSLVLGAMLGAAFGTELTALFPTLGVAPGAYTIAGMGAVAAAVLNAPISTTLIIFELTNDYSVTIAVMLSVVVAGVVARPLTQGSFFEWQLRRRGLDVQSGLETGMLRQLKVGSVLRSQSELVSDDMRLPDLRAALQMSAMGEVFVVDRAGCLYGTVTLADLAEAAFDPTMDLLINASDAARCDPPVLHPNDSLETALKVIHDSGEPLIAVTQADDNPVFVGSVCERDVMAAYNHALLRLRAEERT